MNYILGTLKIIIPGCCLLIMISAYSGKTVKLFNGNDLKGWYAYTSGSGKTDDAGQIFKVENGEIKLRGKSSGYIATIGTFKNFDLKLEFCWETDTSILRNSNVMNSGIMYNVPSDSKDVLWPSGIQFQVKRDHTGDFILLHNITLNVRGTVYGPGRSVVIPRLTDGEKKPGEWNTVEIISEEGRCMQYLNGQLVNEGMGASTTGGRIALLYEGYPVKFRNIEIELME